MADEQENPGLTIAEEIQCLLDAGWSWDGDKLVHPKYKDVWTKYKRIDCNKIRIHDFEWELSQAVRKARQQKQP